MRMTLIVLRYLWKELTTDFTLAWQLGGLAVCIAVCILLGMENYRTDDTAF